MTTSINPVVIYSDDPYANAAFEKMRLNLTLEEIYNLSTYGKLKIEVIEKNQTYLSNAEIAALQMMSYEELYAAYIALVYAAETYGTADYNPNAETTTVTEVIPVVTSSSETSSSTSVAEKTDIAYPEKTDVVTSIAEKTEMVTTSVAEKTDIPLTTYADKTDINFENADKTEITSYYDKTEPIVVTTTLAPTATTTLSTTSSVSTTQPPEYTESTIVNSDDDDVKGETVTAASTPDPK